MTKLLLAICLLAAPLVAQKKAINVNPPSPSRPFSDAILAGDTLYLSGKMGFNDKGELPATFEEEARAALEAQRPVLKAAGFDYANVVKVTVFLADMKDFETWNKVYSEFFKTDRPARSTVQVAGLVRGGHVEVEMIAVRGPRLAPASR